MIRNTASLVLLVSTIAAAALTQATYVHAATKFDGYWSLVVVTRSGPCDPAYRFSGQIVDGAIVYTGGLGPVGVAGRVRPSGSAYLRVQSGANYAVAFGHLTPQNGHGSWHGQAQNGRCSGTWTAART